MEKIVSKKRSHREPLYGLQILRGFAAMLVLFLHANSISQKHGEGSWFTQLFFCGHAGVQFFFVLSGFIMVWIHSQDIGHPASLRVYALKRIFRIYPLYVLVTLVLLPTWLFFPDIGEPYHHHSLALVKSLLLWPQAHPPHLGVGWTLSHEMLFYTLFGMLIWNRHLGIWVLALWFMVTTWHTVHPSPWSMEGEFLFHPQNLLFGFGLLTGWVTLKLPPMGALKHGSLLLGFAIFLTTAWLMNQSLILDWSFLGFGLASILVLFGATSPWVQNLGMRWRRLLLLGNASYALYLIHLPVMSFVGKILIRIRPIEGWVTLPWFFMCLILSGVLAGLILHLWVEKPIQDKMQTWVK